LLERCEVAFAAAHRLARSDQRGFGLRSRLVVDLVGERRRERPSLSVRPFGELVLGAELLQPDDTGVAASEVVLVAEIVGPDRRCPGDELTVDADLLEVPVPGGAGRER